MHANTCTYLFTGIEHIPQLAKFASENIANDDDKEGCLSKYTTVTEGDGRKGLPSQTFDAIHVGAAAPVVGLCTYVCVCASIRVAVYVHVCMSVCMFCVLCSVHTCMHACMCMCF